MKDKLIVVCISDTHHKHNKVVVPAGDVLVHAGDITNRGSLNDLRDFVKWFKKQPHIHKLLIAGNHDFNFANELDKSIKILGDSCTFLHDSEITIKGVKFYGMPWTVSFGNWAFGLPAGSKEMLDVCNKIPDDTNVLITHGPPRGIMDETLFGDSAGCQTLLHRIHNLKHLKAHIFGHIHEGFSIEEHYGVQFVNTSICTINYQPTNKPIVIKI